MTPKRRVIDLSCFFLKLSNALKSLKSEKITGIDQASEQASECHSPHRIYNSLLRMRTIHKLKMSIWGSNFMDFETGSVYTITVDPP